MNARLEVNLLRFGVERVDGNRWPSPTPTPQQRLQDFRAKCEPEIGNAFRWPWYRIEAEGRQYVIEETMDGRYPSIG